jgi:ATP-dependent exoDNAse (exonuclease V) beta subunit
MARRAARIDSTARDLTKTARSLGADVLPLNGIVDCLVLHRRRVFVVDWKSKGGTLTEDQAKLVARGWPIHFVSTEQQLIDLLGVG